MLDMLAGFGGYVKNDFYLKGVLIALQNQTNEDGTVTIADSSACIIAYDSFETTVDGMSASQLLEVYTAARKAKGQGGGTNMGFMISNFGTY